MTQCVGAESGCGEVICDCAVVVHVLQQGRRACSPRDNTCANVTLMQRGKETPHHKPSVDHPPNVVHRAQ